MEVAAEDGEVEAACGGALQVAIFCACTLGRSVASPKARRGDFPDAVSHVGEPPRGVAAAVASAGQNWGFLRRGANIQSIQATIIRVKDTSTFTTIKIQLTRHMCVLSFTTRLLCACRRILIINIGATHEIVLERNCLAMSTIRAGQSFLTQKRAVKGRYPV